MIYNKVNFSQGVISVRDFLSSIRNGEKITTKEAMWMIFQLSIPVIMAQLSVTLMQYIDSAMVGHYDTGASAAIGLVSTSTWLLGGMMSAVAIGFYVQVAQAIGARKEHEARDIVHYGLRSILVVALFVGSIAAMISFFLPQWLGGSLEIQGDATNYFFVFSCSLPFVALNYIVGGFLQATGNMKVPSLLNILMCFLDVIFNFFLIFPTRSLMIFGHEWVVVGAGLGVVGAALGTLLAQVVSASLMLIFMVKRSETLRLRVESKLLSYHEVLKKALKIAVPVGIESIAMSMAYIAMTKIIAPLGTLSLAAHSFAITVESLCYMPGYGIAAAATTIVGQAIGANEIKMAHRLGWLTTALGIAFLSLMGIIMFFFAPQMIGLLSPEPEVIELGAQLLRIEAFAEPLYGASIVIAGVCRGKEDTLIPAVLNFGSMWFVRIPLSLLWVGKYGLHGVWVAMAIELSVRGLILIVRLWQQNRREVQLESF